MYKKSDEVKVYQENHENHKSGIDCNSEKLKQKYREIYSREKPYQHYYS